MGFIVGLIFAVLGASIAEGSDGMFGLVAGAFIGYLVHKLRSAETDVKALRERVELLEQRNRSTEPVGAQTKSWRSVPAQAVVEEPESAVAAEAPPASAKVSTPPLSQAPQPDVASSTSAGSTPRPAMGEHTIEVAKRWLTTGNVPVKVGVIISFFGVAFLLKYAVENQVFAIPVSVRYLAVAAFAVGLLAVGWRKQDANRVFALSVQGGGIGVLFLTVFAAYRLHALLSPTVAFALLILITIGAGALALKQESRALAILGTTGGFLAPLLASTGSGDHVGLFSYYLVLNCAVLGVAWFRPWRELNIIGFVFTFGVGTIWGWQYYVPELFASTEPFLVLFFLFYTAIAVLFAFRQPPRLRGYVDGTLLFGTPVIAFALQSQMLDETRYGLAISAAVVAAFYAALALWLNAQREQNLALLKQAVVALAVAFGTVAVPLALDDRWTAIAWSLEGAALVWIGVQQNTTLAKLSGTALALAGGAMFIEYGWVDNLGWPVLNANCLGGVIIALASLFSARRLMTDKQARNWQTGASIGLLLWGMTWWFGSGAAEILDRVTAYQQQNAMLIFGVASFAAIAWMGKVFDWVGYRRVSLAMLPLLALGALSYRLEFEHFFGGLGAVGWMLAIAAHVWILHCYKNDNSRFESLAHGWGALFFVMLLAHELNWRLARFVANDVWAATPALLLLAAAGYLYLREHRGPRWPFGAQSKAYFTAGLALVGIYTMLVVAACIDNPGSPAPLPYIPLLNPFDVLSIVAVGLAWCVTQGTDTDVLPGFDASDRTPRFVIGGLAFALATVSVVRMVHHYGDVPWNDRDLFDSVAVQTTVTIFWAILGLSGMVFGARSVSRGIWMSGAALMAVVVLKLFTIDLGSTGTVARIISFLGVGIMLLIVGYFSPVPPRHEQSHAAQT